MSVLAIFKYAVKPGRMADFMAKLQAASDPKFNSRSMPRWVRLFQNFVPGPNTGGMILILEYQSMEAYGERTDFERLNEDWRKLFDAQPDSPETLVSVELLTELS